MTEPHKSQTIKEAVTARLARRYRAELRFRAAGLAAIFTAMLILLSLLVSVFGQGIPAFTAYWMKLPVELRADWVDPQSTRSEASLRDGRYNRVLQQGLRDQFPEVRDRRELRDLFALYTPLNSATLMREVMRRPELIGESYVFTMPLSDDLDLYLKGKLVEDREWAGDGELVVSPEADAVRLDFQSPVLSSLVEALPVSEDTSTDRILSATTPSVFIERAGGTIRLTRISADGYRAWGEVLVSESETQDAESWGFYIADTPQSRRRLDDLQLIWTRALVERGVIEHGFNTYLFTRADSREPELAGIKGALFGTLLTMIITMALSIPLGVFTAIYLEEFAPKNRVTDLIEVNINNLAAVPSIVFGLLGLAVFINIFGVPRSTPLVGGLVLSLMTLPTVIIATRAALKAVPSSLRDASLGVGASKTQTVFHHVLPLAAPGILTGSIIGLAQAMGETAPLLMIGMVAFIADAPDLSLDGFVEPATTMPVQVFLWANSAERAWEAKTAAAIIILLVVLIGFNALAVYLRRRFERRW